MSYRAATQLLSTDDRPSLAEALQAAESLDLNVLLKRYKGRTSTLIQIGQVLVGPLDARYRDLGEGPSWQEKYELPMQLWVPLYWRPADATKHYAVSCHVPVTSIMRESGAKFAGVTHAYSQDTDKQPSTHSYESYEYSAFEMLGNGNFFGHAVRTAHGVSVREVPYAHDPTKTHWVMDLTQPQTWSA